MQLFRIGGEAFVFLEIESEAVRCWFGNLRCRVRQNVWLRGEKRCIRFALAGNNGQAKPAGCGRESDFEICRQRQREFVGEASPYVLIGLDVSRTAGGNRAGEVELGLFGDAASATDEPVNLGVKRCRAGGCSAGDIELNWKEHFVFVAEVHQGTEGKTPGDGKLKRAGGDSLRQRPLDVGRLAGVAGVFPVDVPAGFELEVKAGVVGGAGFELRVGADELHVNMGQVGGAGGSECGNGRGEQGAKREDGAESHSEKGITSPLDAWRNTLVAKSGWVGPLVSHLASQGWHPGSVRVWVITS